MLSSIFSRKDAGARPAALSAPPATQSSAPAPAPTPAPALPDVHLERVVDCLLSGDEAAVVDARQQYVKSLVSHSTPAALQFCGVFSHALLKAACKYVAVSAGGDAAAGAAGLEFAVGRVLPALASLHVHARSRHLMVVFEEDWLPEALAPTAPTPPGVQRVTPATAWAFIAQMTTYGFMCGRAATSGGVAVVVSAADNALANDLASSLMAHCNMRVVHVLVHRAPVPAADEILVRCAPGDSCAVILVGRHAWGSMPYHERLPASLRVASKQPGPGGPERSSFLRAFRREAVLAMGPTNALMFSGTPMLTHWVNQMTPCAWIASI